MARPIGRVAAGVAAALLLGAVLAPGVAGAARGEHHDHGNRWGHHRHVPHLTAGQRECLASQGVAPLAGRRDVARWISEWRAAFKACGIRFPHHFHGWRPPPTTTTTSTSTTTTSSTTTTTTTFVPPDEPS